MELSKKIIFLILSFSIVAAAGCANKRQTRLNQTKIIAVKFGRTIETAAFKATGEKPFAYVLWGNDIRDGARCEIVISNVTKAQTVYRRMFTYNAETIDNWYNYERSKIIEYNTHWNRQIGNYYMELFVDGRRQCYYAFSIMP